jgi:hypothetical protein
MSDSKTCTKCGIEKSLEEFSKDKNYKDGYNNQCRDCINEQRRKCRKENLYSTMNEKEIIEYEKNLSLTSEERKEIKVEKKRIYDINYRENITDEETEIKRVKNKEKYLKRIEEMTEDEKEIDREKNRLRNRKIRDNMSEDEKEIDREKNRLRKANRTPEQIEIDSEKNRLKRENRTLEQKQHDKDLKRIWNENNKEHINQYSLERMKDPTVRMVRNLRRRMIHAVKECQGFKYGKSEELLGCSFDEVRKYLESKFKDGMTWENHGLYGWHIDHIKPCASFDLTNEIEQRECFHYTNLQPLWAFDNLSKSDKWEEEVSMEELFE